MFFLCSRPQGLRTPGPRGALAVVGGAGSGVPDLHSPRPCCPSRRPPTVWAASCAMPLGPWGCSSPEAPTRWPSSSLMSPEGEHVYVFGCHLVYFFLAPRFPASWGHVLGLRVFLS